MNISQALIREFDYETASSRRVLERVRDDRLSWRPHPKSMSLGRLASHVAEIPRWGERILNGDSFDIAPVGGPSHQAASLASSAEIVASLESNAVAFRGVLETTGEEAFFSPWSLKRAGNVIFTLPRVAVVRNMIFSHLVHHRGQLTVYLRLTDTPVPGLYGPSADEQ